MATAAVIDIESLLHPISADQPSGVDLPYKIQEQFDRYITTLKGDEAPARAVCLQTIQLGIETLKSTSKNFFVAALITEAAARAHSFAGLRDGLRLMTRLLADCEGRLRPLLEEGDTIGDKMMGFIQAINDSSKGWKLPQVIALLPLVDTPTKSYTNFDLRTELEAAVGSILNNPNQKTRQADLAKFQTRREDMREVMAALEEMQKAVDQRMPEKDISLMAGPGRLGTVMTELMETVSQLSKKLGLDVVPETSAGNAAAGSEDAGDSGGGASVGKSSIGASRDQLYHQLTAIAEQLRRLEPHSPIPFLIERAVRMGGLSFPLLMRAMIQETSAIGELDRLLGIEEPAS